MRATPQQLQADDRKVRHLLVSRLGTCLLACLFAIAMSLLAGAQTPPAAASSTPSALPISAGDLLTIDVFNTPELSGKFRVGQSGTVDIPQGGSIQVSGLTPTQAAAALERRLRDSLIMREPHVTVFVTEYASQGVIVLGEVKLPGTYTLLGEHSLYGALAAAGGVTATAGSSIVITHQGDPAPETILVSSRNFSNVERLKQIRPGDTVFVSPAVVVYVLGDVVHSGAVPMANGVPLNVLKILSLAEGPNRTAKLTKAAIIRDTGEGVVTIPLDLQKIMKNEAPDPLMEASDVLVVPRSNVKAFLDTAVPGATAAVLGAIITALIIR